MAANYYLLCVGILGFEKLAPEISFRKGINAEKMRKEFLSVIQSKLRILQDKRKTSGTKHGGGDDWLLLIDSFHKTLTAFGKARLLI